MNSKVLSLRLKIKTTFAFEAEEVITEIKYINLLNHKCSVFPCSLWVESRHSPVTVRINAGVHEAIKGLLN
jgi:hypothetical protein